MGFAELNRAIATVASGEMFTSGASEQGDWPCPTSVLETPVAEGRFDVTLQQAERNMDHLFAQSVEFHDVTLSDEARTLTVADIVEAPSIDTSPTDESPDAIAEAAQQLTPESVIGARKVVEAVVADTPESVAQSSQETAPDSSRVRKFANLVWWADLRESFRSLRSRIQERREFADQEVLVAQKELAAAQERLAVAERQRELVGQDEIALAEQEVLINQLTRYAESLDNDVVEAA